MLRNVRTKQQARSELVQQDITTLLFLNTIQLQSNVIAAKAIKARVLVIILLLIHIHHCEVGSDHC